MVLRAGRCALAFCALAFLRPAHYLHAQAEEQVSAEGEEKAEASVSEDGEASDDAGDDAGLNFANSAKELQDKLGQLQALLDAKSENMDPETQERLAKLKDNLKTLNLGGMMGGEGGTGTSELVGACTAMAIKRSGTARASTTSQLRRIATGKLSLTQASDLDVMRMIAVCIYDMSSQELALFQAGKLSALPNEMALKAAGNEAKQQVIDLEPQMWSEVQVTAKGLLEQLGGSETASGLPVKYGLLAAVPLLWVFAFLGKKFMDMQKREGGRKDKSAKKKNK